MAKISSTLSYPSIGTVVGTDYWVLTDAESDLATKSVSVNQIQKFLGLEGSAVSQVTVTSAQLLNLANVPMNLIAAPGTDKIIDILSIAVFSDFDTINKNNHFIKLIPTGSVQGDVTVNSEHRTFEYNLHYYMQNRVNTKLSDLGYQPIIDDVDMTAVDRMKWFDHLSAGKQHTDFFANRVTNYSKGHIEWDSAAIF